MEQYIKKSALLKFISDLTENLDDTIFDRGYLCAMDTISSMVNTLEVKEINLEKEIENTINKYYNECEKKLQEMDDNDTDMSFLQLDKFAKHFFELGLKAQKGE